MVVGVLLLAGCSTDAQATTTSTSPSTTTTTATTSTSPSTTTTTTPSTTTTAAPAETTTTSAVPPAWTVLVIGDFGDGSSNELAVAGAMEEYATTTPIAAFVTTGDNLYTDHVTAAWEEPFGWVATMGIPIYAAWGNHDLESPSRREAVIAAFDPPGRWYEAQLGNAVLIVLDANQVTDPEQLMWLESVLAEPRDGPLIVSFHQPAFSCALHGNTPAVIDTWVPLFEAHGVDLVLNGHDHDYERFEHNGVTYVVTGGGGRTLYEIESCPSGTPQLLVGNDDHHHFVALHLSLEGIRAEALTADGELIDEFFLPSLS